MSKRRWRMTQTSNRGGPEAFKDYRFRWWARAMAYMYKGESPLGFDFYTTRVERLDVP